MVLDGLRKSLLDLVRFRTFLSWGAHKARKHASCLTKTYHIQLTSVLALAIEDAGLRRGSRVKTGTEPQSEHVVQAYLFGGVG